MYLTDFGIAKLDASKNDDLTGEGELIGSNGYLAPEQIRGHRPTAQTDFYALACVAFQALTGYPPFHAENPAALRWAHAHAARPLASAMFPELGTRFDGFFTRALALRPQDRFRSGYEFADALRGARDADLEPGEFEVRLKSRPNNSSLTRTSDPAPPIPEPSA